MCSRRNMIAGGRGHYERLPPATNPDALLPLAEIDLGQIVLFHELDQAPNSFYVEDVARTRSLIGHANAPLGRSLSAVAHDFASSLGANEYIVPLFGQTGQHFVAAARDEHVIFNSN